MQRREISYLLDKYIGNRLTYKEEGELKSLLQDPLYNEVLEEAMQELAMQRTRSEAYKEELWNDMVRNITGANSRRAKRLVTGRLVLAWLAAAVILSVILTVVFYKAPDRSKRSTSPIAKINKDILPGSEKAVLTLADGSQVVLDEHGHRQLLQGKVTLVQQGGQLQYNAASGDNSVQFNTLSTPKGGQFQLVLPDGSNVWLNAASALTFPTSFTGADRQVVLKGEAYFEIAADAGKPFVVKTEKEVSVQVLGTYFNINAYENESLIRTTLLQGAVSVTSAAAGNKPGTVLLQPGEQAQVLQTHDSRHVNDIVVRNSVNVGAVVAWKNGAFNLEGASLPEVMRQLERWYDIEVVYEGPVPNIMFAGKISRRVKLSSVLNALEEWGVNFKMNGEKRLVVYP